MSTTSRILRGHSSSFWQVFDKSVSYPLSVKCFSFLQLAPTPSQGPLEVWTEHSKLFMTWCGGVLNNIQVYFEYLQRSNICYWNFKERLSNSLFKTNVMVHFDICNENFRRNLWCQPTKKKSMITALASKVVEKKIYFIMVNSPKELKTT